MPSGSNLAGAVLAAIFLSCFAARQAPAAVVRFDPLDTGAVPRLLSQTGVYADMGAKVPDTVLKPFEVNAPLWSDGSRKRRWLVLPPGRNIPYVDTTDAFDFPQGTMFVKTFLLDSIEGDSTSSVHWETRLLVKGVKPDSSLPKWHGFTYRWNAAGTEAVLVDRSGGHDTAFYYRRADGLRGYRKWRYLSQQECDACHREASNPEPYPQPRGALGFFPVQLKRPDATQAGVNQIERLFNQNVFTGPRPTLAQLAARWKGIQEAVPPGLTGEQRFRFLDTVARSYLGANCSGCHGHRGLAHYNYDFYRFRPFIEFGTRVAIANLTPNVSGGSPVYGEQSLQYRLALALAGTDTLPGAVWDMAAPGNGVSYLIHPGHVSASSLLFRQWMRNTPAMDSVTAWREDLARDPSLRRPWLFDRAWGSAAWSARLAEHGLTPKAFMRFESDGNQMPPLATYLPDTAAMRVLGEWAKTYRTLYRVEGEDSVTRIARHNGTVRGAARSEAVLQGRILIVPAAWEGPVRMIGVSGRVHALYPAGKQRHVIPEGVPPGVYLFKAGNRRFRASILR